MHARAPSFVNQCNPKDGGSASPRSRARYESASISSRFAAPRLGALAALLAAVACGGGGDAQRPEAEQNPPNLGDDGTQPDTMIDDGTDGDGTQPAATDPNDPLAPAAEGQGDSELPIAPAPGDTNGSTPPPTGEMPAPGETPPPGEDAPPTPTDLPEVGTVEDSGTACPPVGQLTGFGELPDITTLPDPFLSLNGTRITTRAQWPCRRAEISALAQQHELGRKPPKPSIVTGALNGNQLTVTAGEPGRTVNFSVSIARPNGAQGAIPAVITIGGSGLSNTFSGAGAAVINLNNGAIGALAGGEAARGDGIFYDLYGQDSTTGSLMAWAWAVSRVIDALEVTPQANIDTTRLAVTGCSRNGKGALVVGAFDERIALTVPQESGAGGSASWRISQAQMNDYIANVNPNPAGGEGIQTLVSAAGEAPWFFTNFFWFGGFVDRLPIDQHQIMAMVAPRALFVIDNTDMQWLGDESSFTSAVAAHEVWTALGIPDAMGASQVGGHPHCSGVPQSQIAELQAYIGKFLIGGGTGNTAILRSDSARTLANRARWISWSTPALE